ncbi:MAG: CHAT domain-containing protein [Pirellulaceae bacterium]
MEFCERRDRGFFAAGVDLVVLSACETGRRVAGGEGLATYSVRSMSRVRKRWWLWKVNDHATLTLMSEFYQNLWDKEVEKTACFSNGVLANPRTKEVVRSLRINVGQIDPAKPALRPQNNSRLNPRYWAAFQLGSDWKYKALRCQNVLLC